MENIPNPLIKQIKKEIDAARSISNLDDVNKKIKLSSDILSAEEQLELFKYSKEKLLDMASHNLSNESIKNNIQSRNVKKLVLTNSAISNDRGRITIILLSFSIAVTFIMYTLLFFASYIKS